MAKQVPKQYTAFEEAQILWECDFPSRPELLESLLKERIQNKETKDMLEVREKEINNSLMAFYDNNRIPGVVYDGYTVSKKSGASVNISKEALILEGVSPETIEKCIKRTPWDTVECRKDKR